VVQQRSLRLCNLFHLAALTVLVSVASACVDGGTQRGHQDHREWTQILLGRGVPLLPHADILWNNHVTHLSGGHHDQHYFQ